MCYIQDWLTAILRGLFQKYSQHRSRALPLASLGGDLRRRYSPDIRVFPQFLVRTCGLLAQNDGNYLLVFYDV
ncbi:hypothetical protein Y032_0681g1478 [Ancylostoma ceylanicum]|uniref:Uncharacterized protein n=1 Tax=Ancylostoma ceylanicum TaxID=53326 RepID=A0A016WIB7_9BILA|nr:hypothetical protein Y032_0681g1478 [Ancylostoma ceylanicum]